MDQIYKPKLLPFGLRSLNIYQIQKKVKRKNSELWTKIVFVLSRRWSAIKSSILGGRMTSECIDLSPMMTSLRGERARPKWGPREGLGLRRRSRKRKRKKIIRVGKTLDWRRKVKNTFREKATDHKVRLARHIDLSWFFLRPPFIHPVYLLINYRGQTMRVLGKGRN